MNTSNNKSVKIFKILEAIPKSFIKDTIVEDIFGKTVRCGEGSVEMLFQDIAQTKHRLHEIDGFQESGPSRNVDPECAVDVNPWQIILIFSFLIAFE